MKREQSPLSPIDTPFILVTFRQPLIIKNSLLTKFHTALQGRTRGWEWRFAAWWIAQHKEEIPKG